jgi:hypothetical protein
MSNNTLNTAPNSNNLGLGKYKHKCPDFCQIITERHFDQNGLRTILRWQNEILVNLSGDISDDAINAIIPAFKTFLDLKGPSEKQWKKLHEVSHADFKFLKSRLVTKKILSHVLDITESKSCQEHKSCQNKDINQSCSRQIFNINYSVPDRCFGSKG